MRIKPKGLGIITGLIIIKFRKDKTFKKMLHRYVSVGEVSVCVCVYLCGAHMCMIKCIVTECYFTNLIVRYC